MSVDDGTYPVSQPSRTEPGRETRPIVIRRAERELFFWTAREGLKLVLRAVLVVYVAVSVLEGRLPGGGLLVHYL